MFHGEAKTSPSQKGHTNVDSFFPLLLSLNPDLMDSFGFVFVVCLGFFFVGGAFFHFKSSSSN